MVGLCMVSTTCTRFMRLANTSAKYGPYPYIGKVADLANSNTMLIKSVQPYFILKHL